MRSLPQGDRRQLRFAIGGMCSIRWLGIVVWTQILLARLALQLTLLAHDGRLLNWSAWGLPQDNGSYLNSRLCP
jgi:hypothetical protein